MEQGLLGSFKTSISSCISMVGRMQARDRISVRRQEITDLV